MTACRFGRILGPCQNGLAAAPGRSRSRGAPGERSLEMTTLKLTTRYARYLLSSLAAVAFGLNAN
jgi:hypothetical protein